MSEVIYGAKWKYPSGKPNINQSFIYKKVQYFGNEVIVPIWAKYIAVCNLGSIYVFEERPDVVELNDGTKRFVLNPKFLTNKECRVQVIGDCDIQVDKDTDDFFIKTLTRID